MPTSLEIARYLQGALLLAQGDERGIGRFDLSLAGFWGSFAAALVAAPAYALVVLEQYLAIGWPRHVPGTALVEILAYLAGWIAFPFAAIFLTRLLDLGARYVPLVVAANWSSVLQINLYALVLLVSLALPANLRALLLFAATVAILVYQWFVIRSALRTTSGIAFGLVVIDVLISMAVSRTIDGLFLPV